MDKEKISEFLEKLESGYSLPTLSPIALKLVELAADENSSVKDLVDLIEKDPSLAVRLLKLANSAFFSTVHPCATLNQAVVNIGFNRLRIMALSISLRDTFPMEKEGPLDYNQFWRISLYRALIAKSLAGYLESTNQDEAFVAGLIREIGLLIFYDIFIKGKDEQVSLDLVPIEDLMAWEKERYGIDHREVGEAALGYWNFPDNIVNCLRSPAAKDDDSNVSDLMKVCNIADSVSAILFLETGQFHSIYEEVGKYLGLDRDKINNMLIQTFAQVDDIAVNLKVELDKEKDLISIMEKANNALSHISEKIAEGDSVVRERGDYPSLDSLDSDDNVVTNTLQAVAHEIRNPLLAVGGFAKKLSDSLEPDSKGGRYSKIILKEASRLEKVLSEMTKKKP
jgi:HD-like signal output (HDOD) protein